MKISRRQILLLGMASAISVGVYLLASHLVYRIGFPLDDAWIHQTYARNLAIHGEWAFIPGQPSGGSTGPLWGALLSVGYILGLGPYLWTFFLGWITLWGLGVLGVYALQLIAPRAGRFAFWGGLLLVLEWHLVWAAVSGMETLAYAVVVILALVLLLKNKDATLWWGGAGLLIGLSCWLRPDGVTLAGPALFVLLFSRRDWIEKLKKVSALSLGFLAVFGPYLVFNRLLSNAWWPNTFFAKQAEYAIVRQELPFIVRLGREFQLPLVGVGLALLPGLIVQFFYSARSKKWGEVAMTLWVLGYLILYALRLPVDYQHGRYVIPMMPAFFLLGFAGFSQWVAPRAESPTRRVLNRTWTLILPVILLVFWGLGAQAYARDVAIIETEMVTVAHWVAGNTSQDALIAAHDIGALGYFGNRDLLDLAGLISPDVIPFIRDEDQLGAYLDSQGADYLVTFPKWYPILAERAALIFQTTGEFSPSLGGENMAVYRWPIP